MKVYDSAMSSIWVKWPLSTFDYTEITINDVLGEAARALSTAPCEARGEIHSDKMYVVDTKRGVYVLCHRCCKALGLPLPPSGKFKGK